MPHMSPMWWSSLLIYFSLSMLLMITFMFFQFSMRGPNLKIEMNKPPLFWKW